ncbi:type II toxin-antitoxin system VapC family toxin [Paralcaligenes ureilyticus]|uniref:Ribonuclease VapC n=1 Tax=Paralcaligenes ureilyticus TaxID=627131 RepID=A0A4R3M7U9_9BURK|nr:type II toxin-antitoxin system VapC family toxin [Paralcaligenes ureilyticus]TCT07405.1 hypothetical protein EDC26_106129 [Paralcaligenes ureilyticus]
MIVLDTNVLSELMRPQPARQVLRWIDAQPPRDLFTTSISMAEMLHGATRLPDGKRKAALQQAVTAMFEEDFFESVLAFDSSAATAYAVIVSQRERLGKPINLADAQIAAICLTRKAVLATRNTKDFKNLDLPLINPWDSAGQL